MKTSRELMLDTFNGDQTETIPIWFMRQAGRYLPEYMEISKRSSFEDRSQNPQIAAEITLQPVKRFDLDAAVIFSDILIPIYGMNVGLEIVPNKGPVIERTIVTPEDVYALKRTTAEEDFPYLKKSLQIVRKEIPDKALIGFSGAPFTLASYLIEGQSTRNALKTKSFALQNPEAFHSLMALLTDIVIDQLQAQIEAEIDFLQVFDSWAGFLSPDQFEMWALPYLKKIFKTVSPFPSIFYARGSNHLIQFAPQLGSNGVSIDNTISLTQAKELCPDMLLQGNLDPSYLLTTPTLVKNQTLKVLQDAAELNGAGYIFNLATGIDKSSKLENVAAMVKTVRTFVR